MKKVLVPLADGFEEIEAIATVDILRRAGLDVVTAGIPSHLVKGARNVRISADKTLEEVDADDFDAIILVGGDGYKTLGQSSRVIDAVRAFAADKSKLVGAICAAPKILSAAGVLENVKATCYPGMERELPYPRTERVVLDRNILTSQGPGTAMEFALKAVEFLVGPEKASGIKRDLVIKEE